MTFPAAGLCSLVLVSVNLTALAETPLGPASLVCSPFDVTRRVDPREELPSHLLPEPDHIAATALEWIEVERWRVDEPSPPPPLVPPGLEGVLWAIENPANAWRVLLPIPPQQSPRLVLPADPCLYRNPSRNQRSAGLDRHVDLRIAAFDE